MKITSIQILNEQNKHENTIKKVQFFLYYVFKKENKNISFYNTK